MTLERLDEIYLAFNRLKGHGVIGANFLRGRDTLVDMWNSRPGFLEKHGKHRGAFASLHLAMAIDPDAGPESDSRWKDKITLSYKSGPLRMDSFITEVDKGSASISRAQTGLRKLMIAYVQKWLDTDPVRLKRQRFDGKNAEVLNAEKARVLRAMTSVPRSLAAAKAVQSRSLAR